MNPPSQFEVCLDRVAAPSPAVSDAEEIAELLARHDIDARRELVLALDALLTRLAYRLGSEAVRRWLLSLPRKSAAAAALRRVLLHTKDETAREAGRCAGVSHTAILKAEKRLSRQLGFPRESSCKNELR
jgi:DNA-directed RNA polymerase specialized sigma24 family protein